MIVQEDLTVSPGECRLMKGSITSTLSRYSADFEVNISGEIQLCFDAIVSLSREEEAEAKCKRIPIAELIFSAQVPIHPCTSKPCPSMPYLKRCTFLSIRVL